MRLPSYYIDSGHYEEPKHKTLANFMKSPAYLQRKLLTALVTLTILDDDPDVRLLLASNLAFSIFLYIFFAQKTRPK
jgi:hypothetical protein